MRLDPWLSTALGLDLLRLLGRFELLALMTLLAVGAYAQAAALQRRWNAAVATRPDDPTSLTRLDWGLALPVLLLRWLTLPIWGSYRLARWGYRRFSVWLDRRREGAGHDGAGTEGSEPAVSKGEGEVQDAKTQERETTEKAEPRRFLAATLGPSYLLAGLWLAGLWFLVGVATPLLASPEGAGGTRGVGWILARRPEWGSHVPLIGHPQVATLLHFAGSLAVWATLARWIRAFYGGRLARDLSDGWEDATTLPTWRRHFAVRDLVRPARPYRRWSVPLVTLALPGLVASWWTLGTVGAVLGPGDLAVAATLWLSWVVHLRLRGSGHRPEPEAVPQPPVVEVAGWQTVLDDLRERLQVAEPWPCEPPRRFEPLAPGDTSGSPLLGELLTLLDPVRPGLTAFQQREIARLSRRAETGQAVEGTQEATAGALELGASGLAAGHAGEVEGREHRIVLAPEGWGKTTLGFLAAVDQVLVHSRSALVVVRRPAEARRFEERYRSLLERSTLRWNVRLRRVGADLEGDLARGIVPDLVLTDLAPLVTAVLADTERHAPWLGRLGLVVVDDAEGFAGAVEVHAQLALRRLLGALRELQGTTTAELREPRMLMLGRDSMDQAERWMAELCGVEASVRRETDDLGEARDRQRAQAAARGQGAEAEPATRIEPSSTEVDQSEALKVGGSDGHHQRFYRLVDFRTSYGDPIRLGDLVASCERHAVPWHYRRCGDGHRHLGIGGLVLGDHPDGWVEAEHAAVVILAGSWSEVRREVRNLRRAGTQFGRFRRADGSVARPEEMSEAVEEPIALILQTDPDDDMALTQRDSSTGLARWLDRLPLPLLRPPAGEVLAAHLAADLGQRWLEVGDLVTIYGAGVTDPLRRLAEADLLLAEPWVDLDDARREHRSRLRVRGLLRGLDPGEPTSPLPPAVDGVELTAPSLRVVNRTTRLPLLEVDAAAATLAFYPGRLFTAAGGRFAVVGRDEGGTTRPVTAGSSRHGAVQPVGDLLAEPVLVTEVSSPRRRLQFRSPERFQGSQVPTFGPDPFYFGQWPIALALGVAEVVAEHHATARIDPVAGEVRQLHRESPLAQAEPAGPLLTEVLRLLPNPETPSRDNRDNGDGGAPSLRFGAARLVTAAISQVLPSLYRGGGEALGVGLEMVDDDPPPDHPLAVGEGIVFFDLGSSGTGAVRSLARDGVEVLLRLVRLVLERVLDHRRLLALHDHWPHPDPMRRAASSGTIDTGTIDTVAIDTGTIDSRATSRIDLERRREALAWLDSRLRPEGGPMARPRDAAYGWDTEQGEGDLFDLGRCWWSPTGSVDDLLWVKHRWRRADGREACLDVGFHRATAEASRWLTEDSEELRPLLVAHQHQLEAPDDGPDRRPRPALHVEEGVAEPMSRPSTPGDGTDLDPELGLDPEALSTDAVEGEADDEADSADRSQVVEEVGDWRGDENLVRYHALASAVAAHQRPMLEPLARKLREERDSESVHDLATWLSRYVQGIPYSQPQALRHGLRPPVSTLLFRRGDCDSKSLLLALLLDHCGLESGLFVSFEEGHALAAVVSEALPSDGSECGEGPDNAAPDQERPAIWVEGSTGRLVPVESTVYSPVGVVRIEKPESWTFLPLNLPSAGSHPSDRVVAKNPEEREISR